jgi:hypothetical protein
MPYLLTIAAVVVVLVAVVLALAARRPSTFRYQRSTVIQAPAEDIFGIITDFRNWDSWSPWSARDPHMKRSISGPPQGVGAAYEWNGNRQVGEGRIEIVETAPPSRVVMKLDFLRPFACHNTVEFTLDDEGGATRVTWALSGPEIFFGKVLGLFLNMDRMVGRDFETGLASLKAFVERPAVVPSPFAPRK